VGQFPDSHVQFTFATLPLAQDRAWTLGDPALELGPGAEEGKVNLVGNYC
jgi:hypothetical protein